MAARRVQVSDVVARLGGHPVTALGIELDAADGPGRWLVAACLYGGRIDERVAENATRLLRAAGLADAAPIALADPATLASMLDRANYPKPERAALQIWRISRSLAERHRGSLDALAAECDSLEDLGARLAGLAPGFGAAGVARFLRPLRDRWTAASEIPLHPAARAAAVHLGVLTEGEDVEGEPGALRAALQRDPAPPALFDAEFALARLGAAACVRNRTTRCPLGTDCPALSES
jgi:hypothetical protein